MRPLSHHETVVLLCIAYFQPITRGELSDFFGREVSRDLIAHLARADSSAPAPARPGKARRTFCRTSVRR